MAVPFVDAHPQAIAATIAVRSVPEALAQAIVVILVLVQISIVGSFRERLPSATLTAK